MNKIADLLFGDPAVMQSTIAAAALILIVVRVVPQGWPAPPSAVIAALAVAFPLSEVNLDRYVANPYPPYPAWILIIATLALTALAGSTFHHRNDHPARRALTAAVAAIAIGLFLAVPETGVLRTTIGPLALLTVATARRWLPPFTAMETVAVVVCLAWVAAVDGTTRSTTLLGLALAAGLAAAVPFLIPSHSLAASPPTGHVTADGNRPVAEPRRWLAPAVTLVAVVAGCRLVGTSTTYLGAALYGAAVVAVVVGAATVGVLVTALGLRSEQFDGAHR